MAKVSVLGSGAQGTALAVLLSDNGYEILPWSPFVGYTEELRRTRKPSALGGLELSAGIQFMSDMKRAGERQDAIVLATALVYTRGVAREPRPYVRTGQLLVHVAKGTKEKSLLFRTDEVQEEIPDTVVACLSGSSHVEEAARRLPTTCVTGAADSTVAEQVQELFMNRVFRVYTSTDVKDIELSGAAKNVIAPAAGIADGPGCGDNTKAALIMHGIVETARLGVKINTYWETFVGLTGTGDLIMTRASVHSGNRRADILIDRGKPVEEAMWEVGQVVEGVCPAKAAPTFAEQEQVEILIVDVVNRMLFPKLPVTEAVHMLVGRDPITEWNYL